MQEPIDIVTALALIAVGVLFTVWMVGALVGAHVAWQEYRYMTEAMRRERAEKLRKGLEVSLNGQDEELGGPLSGGGSRASEETAQGRD